MRNREDGTVLYSYILYNALCGRGMELKLSPCLGLAGEVDFCLRPVTPILP